VKKWLWGLVVVIPLWGSSQTQVPPTLSLDDAIGIAEHNAFSLKTAASGVEQAHQGVNAAKGLFGPTLSASANYTHIVDHSSLGSLGSTTGATTGTTGVTTGSTGVTTGSTGTSSLSELDFADTQEAIVALSIPIDISGVMLKGVRAAQASYNASKASFAAADNDLRLSVRQAYFQIVQDKAQIDVAQESVKNAQQTLTNAQEKLTAGTLARYDVLQYETQLSQSQSDLITAQTNLAVAKENFNDILARPIDTPFDVADVTALPEVSDTPEALIQKALTDRPDVRAQKETIWSLKYQTQATEASMDPSMQLGADHIRIYDPGTLNTVFSENEAFVNLNIPLWDSGVTRAKVKESRQQVVQAEIALQKLNLSIALEVQQDLSNLTSSKAKLEVAQKQVDQAKEQYRLAVVRANAGEGITLDVTNAQTQLTTAETGLVNARYAYLIAYAALQRAIDQDGAKVPPIVPPVEGKKL
jgi:outer membrane protein TolC